LEILCLEIAETVNNIENLILFQLVIKTIIVTLDLSAKYFRIVMIIDPVELAVRQTKTRIRNFKQPFLIRIDVIEL